MKLYTMVLSGILLSSFPGFAAAQPILSSKAAAAQTDVDQSHKAQPGAYKKSWRQRWALGLGSVVGGGLFLKWLTSYGSLSQEKATSSVKNKKLGGAETTDDQATLATVAELNSSKEPKSEPEPEPAVDAGVILTLTNDQKPSGGGSTLDLENKKNLSDVPPGLDMKAEVVDGAVDGQNTLCDTSNISHPKVRAFVQTYTSLVKCTAEPYPLNRYGSLNFRRRDPIQLDQKIQSLEQLTAALEKFLYTQVDLYEGQQETTGFFAYQDLGLFAKCLQTVLDGSSEIKELRSALAQLPIVVCMHEGVEDAFPDLSVLSHFGHLSIKYHGFGNLAIKYVKPDDLKMKVNHMLQQVKCPSIGILGIWETMLLDPLRFIGEDTKIVYLDLNYSECNIGYKLSSHVKHVILSTWFPSNRDAILDHAAKRWCYLRQYTENLAANPIETLRFLHGWANSAEQDILQTAVLTNHKAKKVIIHPRVGDMKIDQKFYAALHEGLNQHPILERIDFYQPATEFSYATARPIYPPLVKGETLPALEL